MKTFAAATLASSALVTLASAQQQYSIDPNSVSNSTRQNWCQSQVTQCPLICLQTSTNAAVTEQNSCDADSLTYTCVCGDGTSPNVTEYTQTLPYWICQEWGTQCVSNCGQDNTCSSNCREQHPCGAQNPVRQNTSTLSSTMSKTSTGAPQGATTSGGQTIYTGFGGAAASSTGGNGGSDAAQTAAAGSSGAGRAAALQAGQTFGLLAVVGGLFGGFALLL